MKTLLFISFVLLASCGGGSAPKVKPQAVNLAGDEIGYYMQMIVADHDGPKAQLWLEDQTKPIWFVDVRDAIKFTRSPEEADNIAVIYAHDMAKNPDYRRVKDIWVDLEDAVFVIKSSQKGGMGMPETIPFSDKNSALKFIEKHGGVLISSAEEITPEYLNSMPDRLKMNMDDMMHHYD